MQKKIKILLIVLCVALAKLLISSTAMAAPVFGEKFSLVQPDGTYVDVKIYGDEFYQRVESLDGYTLVRDPLTEYICYAKLNSDGSDFESTGIVYMGQAFGPSIQSSEVMTKGLELDAEHILKKVQASRERLGLVEDQTAFNSTDMDSTTNALGGPQSILGITIVIDFQDVTSPISTTEINNYLNQPGYTGFGNNGSIRDYFFDVSGGMVDFSNVVFYYKSPNNKSYYDTNAPLGLTTRALIIEALNYLNATDPSFRSILPQLTKDVRGDVMSLNVLYAGFPSWGGGRGLWSHAAGIPSHTVSGTSFSPYQITYIGNNLVLSRFAHEVGHSVFGFPDLYDISYQTFGLGDYCLMAYGGSLFNPVPPTAQLRMAAGWTQPIDLNGFSNGSTITVQANALAPYKFSPNLNNEYYLIERLQQTGRYASVPGNGIVIYHVDTTKQYNPSFEVSPTAHPFIYIVPADMTTSVRSYVFPTGDNLYPFGSNNSFTSTSRPNVLLWNGADPGLRMTNISTSGTFIYNFVASYKPGDINGDGNVNIIDLNILLGLFGQSGANITNPRADLNGDGNVNIIDLNILLGQFGT